ncbi:hypothetical protein GOBAR_AA28968 [Gossypium barbadense]|uniref:Uncharacterized protein n=1 Tax=Gossypium barbadense TaxID=3634 RepID=A0A2P5WKW4_GOSBA|nr:hypothetical protein GOBAR_AA28968 [Gossypium barbadense]
MNGSLLSTNFVVGKSLTRSNSGVGQAKKKVRRRTDPSPNMDDLIVDENGQKIEDVGVDKLLYKSMLMGTSPYVYLPEKLEEEFGHRMSLMLVLEEYLGTLMQTGYLDIR